MFNKIFNFCILFKYIYKYILFEAINESPNRVMHITIEVDSEDL